MNLSVTRPLAASALVVVGLAFAGCGKDEKATSKDPAARTSPALVKAAKSGTPRAEWVLAACKNVAQVTPDVKPPAVQPSTPEKTRESLRRFFGDLAGVLGKQHKALETVGPPPGPRARAAYERAVTRLDDVESEIASLRKKIDGAKLDSADDLNVLLDALGRRMQKMSSYQGPMADLVKSKALGKAIAREPQCAKLGGGLGATG